MISNIVVTLDTNVCLVCYSVIHSMHMSVLFTVLTKTYGRLLVSQMSVSFSRAKHALEITYSIIPPAITYTSGQTVKSVRFRQNELKTPQIVFELIVLLYQ